MNIIKNILGFGVSSISVFFWIVFAIIWTDASNVAGNISMWGEITLTYIINTIFVVFLISYNIVLYKTKNRNNILVLLFGFFCTFLWCILYFSFAEKVKSSVDYDIRTDDLEWSMYLICAITNLFYVVSQIVYAVLYWVKYKKSVKEDPIEW